MTSMGRVERATGGLAADSGLSGLYNPHATRTGLPKEHAAANESHAPFPIAFIKCAKINPYRRVCIAYFSTSVRIIDKNIVPLWSS